MGKTAKKLVWLVGKIKIIFNFWIGIFVKIIFCITDTRKTHGAMAYWLRHWISNLGVPCSKPLGGAKVDSAFHPSKVDKMGTRSIWELSGKN